MKPLAIDLFCGLGGWASGLLAEGYHVCGVDIERHVYGAERYPGSLWLQDVLTLDGAQFRDAALIVASPPCQFFSYTAMPWSRAKALAAEVRADPARLEKELALFNACFRIQREASAAAGLHVPMVVENVRGAIPWVGRSRWNFGSFHLWGDVPAVMPFTHKARKFNPDGTEHGVGSWFAIADSKNRGASSAKLPGYSMSKGAPKWNMHHADCSAVVGVTVGEGVKQHGSGAAWFDKALDERRKAASDAIKVSGDWFGNYWEMKAAGTLSPTRATGKNTTARKAAAAIIAKIPETLARHIARVYRPANSLKP